MKTNKSKSSQINIQSVALVVVLIFLIICHGGYSFSVIVLSGAVMSVLLAFATKGVSISLSQGIFTVFSLWYFICSLRHGFITEYAAKGALRRLSSRFDGIGGLPRGDKGRIETSLVPPWKSNRDEIILNN